MGNLTTFAITGATEESLRHCGAALVGLLQEANGQERRRRMKNMNVRVFPSVHSGDAALYVQHKGKIYGPDDAIPAGIRAIVRDEHKRMLLRDGGLAAAMPDPRSTSLDDSFVIATVYNDRLSELRQRPFRFAVSLSDAVQALLRREETPCYAQTIVQPPMRKDAYALYVCSGNTMTWFDANSPEVPVLRNKCPEFYAELLRSIKQA